MKANRSSKTYRDAALFLIRRSYASEHRNLEAISGRSSWFRPRPDDWAYEKFLAKCERANCNPFHVIRVDFGTKQLADMPVVPSQLFDSARMKQYRQLSESWREELPERLLHSWAAAKFAVDELSITFDCTFPEAGQIAFENRRLPILFGHCLYSTYGMRLPLGSRDEALRNFCLAPEAHTKAASSVGLEIPQKIARYGKVLRWLRTIGAG